MATFAELRDRLSPDVHKRGKQFERVCKWLLETDPRYVNRLSKVWLWDDWPGRWGPDCGIDAPPHQRVRPGTTVEPPNTATRAR